MLPQNIDAEQAVLGSLLIDARAIERVASFLRPEDFYLPVNAEIYRGMLALYERDRPADIVTLSDHLRALDRLDDMGGEAYLTSLATIVPTSLNAEYYARIVERLAVLRRLVDAGARISSIGYDERLEADAALEEAERVLFEISRLRVTRDFEPLSKVLAEVYEKIDYIHSHDSEVTGVTTGFIDLDRLTSGMQRSDLLILAARPSMGKCLTGDTLIDNPETGERVTIEECVRRRLPFVFGLSDEGRVRPTAVGAWVDSGVKPCFRVTTRTGRTVQVTGHHPFLTVRGWQPLHDLSVGCKIAVPRRLPCFGNDTSWHPDLVRLLAYFIAEGGLSGTSPGFTNTDPDIVQDFRTITAHRFPTCGLRRDRITYFVGRPDWRSGVNNHLRGGANPVMEWLRGLGLMGKRAEEKSFPACVWQWDRASLAEFLRALFSCDGTIYEISGYPRIEFTVASRALAADVHHALTRFGVVSKIWQKTGRSWRVEITEPESVALYGAEIGWIGEKARRFPSHRAASLRRSNVGHPPAETWQLVAAAARREGLPLIELARRSGEISPECRGKYAGYNPHIRRGLPRHRLAGYADVLDDPDLKRLASSDIFWDEIISIEFIGDRQVYDLTVPNGANFIAQDVCVHNTSLALNIAHTAALKAGLPVGIFSIEMSAEQLAHRFISMESQVDSQKLRSGRMSDSDWDRLVQAIGILSEAPIFVDDTPALSTIEMRSKARRLHTEQGLGLIIVDYLQLMQGASNDSRVQEISAISRSLKAVARELDVPVLALSQLSRAPEQRPNHEPMLSDLRESGCLAGESLVYLPDPGVYRRIDELEGQTGFRVLALNETTWKLEPRRVLRAFSTGRKPVYCMATWLGRTIRATSNHRFLTIEGWKRLDELMPGTRIALPRHLPGPRRSTMRDEELALLGHLIGDGGTLPRHAVQCTTNDPVLRVVPAMKPIGLTRRQLQAGLGNAYCGTGLYRQNLSRTRTARLARVIQPSELTALPDSDVYWDEIVSIEPEGETDVYDLTVDELHSFVCDDIIVHNSIEQDADVVMFIYRDVVYNKETERPHVADVIVAKHRNGPTGKIHLFFQESLMKFLDLSVRDDG